MSPDLLLLFPADQRPSAPEIAEVVAELDDVDISAQPRPILSEDSNVAPLHWLELQMGALTFDCTGLAPGRPQELTEIHDWLDIAEAERPERMRSLGLALGPHLQPGRADLSIFRGLLSLAHRLLLELPQCLGICWTPSGIVVSREAFLRLVDPQAVAAPLPVGMLVSFRPDPDAAMESRGLAYFTAQELRLQPGVLAQGVEAKQFALRLIAQLIHRGMLTESESVTTPDGRTVCIEPSTDGRLVRVRPG